MINPLRFEPLRSTVLTIIDIRKLATKAIIIFLMIYNDYSRILDKMVVVRMPFIFFVTHTTAVTNTTFRIFAGRKSTISWNLLVKKRISA